MMFEVSVRATFSAAHRLKGYRGKCENIHGHNWEVEVFIGTETLDKQGISIDFKLLKSKLKDVLAALDHCDLNRINFFKKGNPSAENIAKYIYINLKKTIKSKSAFLRRISVWETKDSCATYFE
ncbi:MAG: 6-carboxytetrahydropterin synthase QueD [Candidatus Omnitrophota bacterium]|nr:6-carboxytetrahydropterin synthase QueD [Candidatus Omnitrophota bacterium]